MVSLPTALTAISQSYSRCLASSIPMAMESPNVVVTVEDGTETEGIKEKRTVRFQCGLLRETETFVGQDVEFLCRETLLDYICDMLTVKVKSRV